MITREMGGGRKEWKGVGNELALLWLLHYYNRVLSGLQSCVLETLRLSGAVVCVRIPAPENRKFLHKCLLSIIQCFVIQVLWA